MAHFRRRMPAQARCTQERASASVDDEDVLHIIAEVLPVVGVPEMVLAHLVGHDGLTDNDLKVLEKWLGMTKEYDAEAGYERTLLGGVEHSFDDKPSYVGPFYRRWTRNGEAHRSHGPALIVVMDGVHESHYYCDRGSRANLPGIIRIHNKFSCWQSSCARRSDWYTFTCRCCCRRRLR
jgi:hypothetical protein